MPSKRTRSDRHQVEFLSAYQCFELLTGKIDYPMMRYDGYGEHRLLRARRERPCRRAAEKCDELASAYAEHGLLLGTRAPAYRRLRMPRKRPQVLGVDLNRSESRRRRPAPQ